MTNTNNDNAMGRIINKFLLAGDKFMPEMHLKQPGFTYSDCGPFTEHKERINKFMKTGDTRYIYRNDLDKACFQHDAAYSDSKDLAKRTASDKVLKDKAFNIANNPKYNGYERGLASMVYKFFDKNTAGGNISSNSDTPLRALLGKAHANKRSPQKAQREQVSESLLYAIFGENYGSYMTSSKNKKPVKNVQLANELHKPIIRKFKKRKVYSSYVDQIWAADLADMQLLNKKNKGIRYLLCVIDLFSRYAYVVPLKDKKGNTVVEAFQKILNKTEKKQIKYRLIKEKSSIIKI